MQLELTHWQVDLAFNLDNALLLYSDVMLSLSLSLSLSQAKLALSPDPLVRSALEF